LIHFYKRRVIKKKRETRAMVKIYVGKLSGDTTDQDLRGLFEQYGNVDEAERVRHKDIGFVHMPNEQSAMLAVRSSMLKIAKVKSSVL